MKKAVCLFYTKQTMNGKNLILAVSRKDNQDDFGLPGGKIEENESPVLAMSRECIEETGYCPIDLSIFEITEHQGYELHTFLCRDLKRVSEVALEPGVVAWVQPKTLESGSFGKYNKRLISTLMKRGLYEN